jgi:GPH family glycoside/pentoside/hexuronide:cation symporter
MWKIFSYGFLALPLSILGITYYVFLPSWYVSDFGASIGQIGIYLMLARFWDAFTDPLIGVISDKLKNKNISRTKFIMFGVVLVVPATYLLFNPILSTGLNVNIVFLINSLFFYFALTCVSIPYEALGVEYAADQKLRSNMLAARDGLFLFGTVLASAIPYVVINKGVDPVDRNFILSLIYLGMLVFTFLILVFSFKENETQVAKKGLGKFEWNNAKKALFNKNFMVLLIAFIVSSLGAALPASLFMFFVRHYLGLSEADGVTSLLIYFIVGFLSVPVWLFLANRYNKKYVWFVSQIVNAGTFLPVYLLSNETSSFFNFFILFSAMGLGGVIILPSIIQADYIHSISKNLEENPVQGLVVGVWSVAKKFSQGIGTGIGFYILSIYSFNPELVTNSQSSIQALGFLYAVVPSVLCFCSIIIALNYKQSSVDIEFKNQS